MSRNLVLQFLIVNYYAGDLIAQFLISLRGLSIKHGVTVVNNSPGDRSIQNLNYPNLEIIEAGSNLGFGRACNLGLYSIYTRSVANVVWLVNPDAYFLAEDIVKIPDLLTAIAPYPIVGTAIYDEGGALSFSGGKFDRFWGTIGEEKTEKAVTITPIEWVSGCSMILNLGHFPECPQFDEDFFLYYEDFEFCQRYRHQGYAVVISHQVKVIHHRSSLTSKLPNKLSHEIFSYLLALYKQSSKFSLYYRLIRISIKSIGQILVLHPQGIEKLKGVKKFIQFCLAHSRK